jgi:hypothetical protein
MSNSRSCFPRVSCRVAVVYTASSRGMRYIHFSAGKRIFGCHARFTPANLLEPLRAIIGADMSSFRARGCRTCGIFGTWKQVVNHFFLRNVLPANHQMDGRSYSGSIQTNNILAFPSFLPLVRSSLQNINGPEFPQSKLPPSPSTITIPPLFFLCLHCNAYEFRMVSILETNEFGSSTEIVHKFGIISADNRPTVLSIS